MPFSDEPFWPFVATGVASATVAPSDLAAAASAALAAAASAGVVCAKPWAEPALVTFFCEPVWAGWFFFCWTGFWPTFGAVGFCPGFGPSVARFSAASTLRAASSLSIFV